MSVRACPISSFGIFEYSAGQLGLPGDPNRIVNVFRPESAINDPEAIASFQTVPFIDDHEMLSGFEGDEDATAPEDYGIEGVLTNVQYDSGWLKGDLKIFTRRLQRALDSGKCELSLGYSCDFLEQPGTWNGQDYEVVQTNMRGNHIALVDAARVQGARVLDGRSFCFDSLNFSSISQKGIDMAKNVTPAKKLKSKTAVDNAVAKLQALIPQFGQALEEFMAQEAGEPAHQGAEGAAAGGASAEGGEGAANPAASAASGEGAANPAAPESTGAEGDGGAGGESGAGGNLAELISQAEALIGQLKAATSGGAAGGAAGDEGEEGEGEDTVEGLANGGNHEIELEGAAGDEGEAGSGSESRVKAPEGPAAGTHAQAGDAALRRFYADLDAKTRIYGRLSKVVGAFDHARMDARQVAAYGVKKLGLKGVMDGQEIVAVESFLEANERASKSAVSAVTKQTAQDSAVSEVTEAYAAYMSGK
ncbi:putative capsid maturation protease [Burkholderia phage Maja]|uniref:Putative capsid maturation protease n=1 Tax=Burkholderia phage Maja TaxID=2767571 RepID=A0A7S6R8S3_9CAUD|nr:putative capsid maturation protease [Burkholderia phage Maja]